MAEEVKVAAKKATTKTTEAKTASTKTAAPKQTKTVAKPSTQTKAPAKTAPAKEVKVAEVKTQEVKAPVIAEAKPQVKAPVKKVGPQVKIKLIKSPNGRLIKQKRTLEALGLKKLGNETIKPDNAQIRGMIFVVKHLVSVESVKEK